MAKKQSEMTEGVKALFGKTQQKESDVTQGVKRKGFGAPRSQRCRIPNRYSTSLVVDRLKYEKIRQIAVDNSLNINEVVNVALSEFVEKYEQKFGEISSRESNISAAQTIWSAKN